MIQKIFSNAATLLILATLFWSGNFIVGRAASTQMDPITLAFWRWVFASCIALFLARKYIADDLKALCASWPSMLVLSATGVACFNTLVYLGLKYTVAINGLLLQSMIPVLIVFFSFVLFRERLSFVQSVGVILSLCGVLTIVSRADYSMLLHMDLNHGDALIFLAVVCYAIYSVSLRKRPKVHPLSFLAASFVIGTILLFPVYLFYAQPLSSLSMTPPVILSISYVAIFPSIVSYLCYNRGVELAGASRAGMSIHLMPVFGSLMAIAFLGERLYAFHIAGILLIACGIYLATKKK